jgi:hypothetical protein
VPRRRDSARVASVRDVVASLADVSPATGEMRPRTDQQLGEELLADYFAILREWMLNSRSENGLAPDATAGEP